MRTAVIAAIAAVQIARGSVGSTPQTVFEGKNEVLYLDQWAAPNRWRPAECTVAASKERVAEGRPTLHLHIPIDHHGGEKKYPVGWPRMDLGTRELWEKDWTNFDRLEFAVYTTSSRTALPKTPISLLLYCPNKQRAWHRPLRELKLDQWVKYSMPVSRMPHVDDVATVKFSVSESQYKHGDQVDFYIGAFRFVRSAECELAELKIKTTAIFQGRGTLDVEVDVLGVPKGLSRAVSFTIRQDQTVIRQENLPVHRGRYVLEVDVSELRLGPGTYSLVAFEGEKDREKSGTFRVVASPWKEQ